MLYALIIIALALVAYVGIKREVKALNTYLARASHMDAMEDRINWHVREMRIHTRLTHGF